MRGLGRFATGLACLVPLGGAGLARVAPRGAGAESLDFWFQLEAPHLWRGRRLPLYTEGPEVLVVREDGGRMRDD